MVKTNNVHDFPPIIIINCRCYFLLHIMGCRGNDTLKIFSQNRERERNRIGDRERKRTSQKAALHAGRKTEEKQTQLIYIYKTFCNRNNRLNKRISQNGDRERKRTAQKAALHAGRKTEERQTQLIYIYKTFCNRINRLNKIISQNEDRERKRKGGGKRKRTAQKAALHAGRKTEVRTDRQTQLIYIYKTFCNRNSIHACRRKKTDKQTEY